MTRYEYTTYMHANIYNYIYIYTCVCLCVRACVRACVRVCVCKTLKPRTSSWWCNLTTIYVLIKWYKWINGGVSIFKRYVTSYLKAAINNIHWAYVRIYVVMVWPSVSKLISSQTIGYLHNIRMLEKYVNHMIDCNIVL